MGAYEYVYNYEYLVNKYEYLVDYAYFIKLMKKFKGPCGDLILNNEARLTKTENETVCLSIKSDNGDDCMIPVNSMERTDEGFIINGDTVVKLEGVLPEFIAGNLRPEILESMIKDSIRFQVSWKGYGIKFVGNEIGTGLMTMDLTGKEIKVRSSHLGFELIVENSKFGIPGTSSIILGKRKPKPVGNGDKPLWED